MGELTAIRELVQHNYWARDRQLEACDSLSEDEFLRPMGGSFSSLRDTLAHLLHVEWVWLERWQGRSPQSMPGNEELHDVPTLALHWAEVEKAMRAYVAGLTEADLGRRISYTNFKGETWTYPLGRMLHHVLMHQNYHRGQVTILLRQLGVHAAAVDFLNAVDARII